MYIMCKKYLIFSTHNNINMFLEILKNPIVLGILASAITYMYLLWDKKKKAAKKTDGEIKKDINLMIPLIAGITVCIVAYIVFCSNVSAVSYDIPQVDSLDIKYKFSDEMIKNDSASVGEIRLVSRGVNIPNRVIPAVFMETYS